jgi:hypothetical protein
MTTTLVNPRFTLQVENPLLEPVSVSCTCCAYQDFGQLRHVERPAIIHSETHPVRLSVGFIEAGVWVKGAFRQTRGRR